MNNQSYFDIPVVRTGGASGEASLCRLVDLPVDARVPGAARDDLFMRLAEIQRTSHMLILAPSMRPCHDVDCASGYVAEDGKSIAWNRECISQVAAIGVFAIRQGFIHRERMPQEGTVAVRIWQQNICKTIIAYIPVANGMIDMRENIVDAVRVELVDPVAAPKPGVAPVFPTGAVFDRFDLPGVGMLGATVIDIGAPTVFVDIADSGAKAAVAAAELSRALRAAVASRTGNTAADHRIVYVSAPRGYVGADGTHVAAEEIDLCAWGAVPDLLGAAPGVVEIGIAAGIPGTIVSRVLTTALRTTIRVGYPEGVVPVEASSRCMGGEWIVTRVLLRGYARVLSESIVRMVNQGA